MKNLAILQNLPGREIHLIVGFLQGLAVYGLVENGEWLAERLHIALPLWLLVLVWPTAFLLSFTREHVTRTLVLVSGLSFLLALLALHTGWQATPNEAFDSDSLVAAFAISMLVALFVSMIHLQPRVSRIDTTYEVFFTLSWRNFLTVGFSWALMLGVRLVLFLWESLFAVIGIDFFERLFARGWFIGPVLGMSFAFGLYSFRAATSLIDSVSSLLARLTWLLLPILLLLVASFLCTLPFVGIEPLWDTDHGTLILMAANLIALFFVNAVYQTGDHTPYPHWPHRALMIGIAMLPIISALACYGLLLRVGQYGWSIARLWAMLVVVLMACFSIGYLYIIVRRRANWQSQLPSVNRRMSWVVLASMLLTASPLLDFRVISTWSQFSRFEAGLSEAIDLKYVRETLGRAGYSKLEALQARDPTILERVERSQHLVRGWAPEAQEGILKRPASMQIPEALSIAVKGYEDEPPKMLIQAHLDEDELHEYVTVWSWGETLRAVCWTQVSDEWSRCGSEYLEEANSAEEILAELLDADIEAVIPQRPYKDLRFGERRMEFE